MKVATLSGRDTPSSTFQEDLLDALPFPGKPLHLFHLHPFYL
jgi:hypothetical protein